MEGKPYFAAWHDVQFITFQSRNLQEHMTSDRQEQKQYLIHKLLWFLVSNFHAADILCRPKWKQKTASLKSLNL